MRRTANFTAETEGAITALNLYLIVATAIFSGVAIDVSNLVSQRTQLQVAADSAAHTAIFIREDEDPNVSRDAAIAVAARNMPVSNYGNVLRPENIHFGEYDRTTGTFDIDEDARDAVFVETDQLSENGNPISSFLLQLVGFSDWDVRTGAVFATYYPTCLREGFVAQDVVDIQSNNTYFDGFCIHSNAWVEMNLNNYYEAGTIVSMPDSDLLVVPEGGLDDSMNEGLTNALREGKWWIKILNRLDEIVDGAMTTGGKYSRSYITSPTAIEITTRKVGPSDLTPGRIHYADCARNFTFEPGIYENVVVKSSCNIVFNNGSEFRNSVIISEDTSSKSMEAPANLVLGTPDDCDAGGGTVLISYGTVHIAADLEMHGSQIIAAENVEFQANATGIRGASIIAGGRIDGNSGMDFAFCGSGMGGIYEAAYFRLER